MWKGKVRVLLEGLVREVLLRVEGRVRLMLSEVGRRRGEKAELETFAGSAGREALKLRRVRKRVRVVCVKRCIIRWLLLVLCSPLLLLRGHKLESYAIASYELFASKMRDLG